ncbi:response regulator [Lactonifactor longoviformis]|nr:response regulator [Lactonifactor longoviformis]
MKKKMFKVIIVDDEMLIRKRIRLGFDWNALGYEVEDDVGSGGEALRLITERAYDLAIVDIAMPGMNGIELVKRLREENLPIHIIFLTGHSDFAYAQQAIKYGVYDYILKPVNEEEFTRMLEKLRDKLVEEKREHKLLENLSLGQSDARLIMEAKFFSDIFQYGIQEEIADEIAVQAGEAGVDTDAEYTLSVFRIQLYTQESLPLLEQSQKIYEAGRRVMDKGEGFTVLFDLFNNYCILFKEWSVRDSREGVKGVMEQVRKLLEQKLETVIRCGISSRKKGIRQLVNAYTEAVCALNNTKAFREKTMGYEDVDKRGDSHYRVSSAKIKEVQNCVGKNDPMGCERMIRMIFDEMIGRQCNYECISMNANRLLLGISEACIASGLEIRRFMGEYKSLEAAFEYLMTLGEIKEWFCGMVKALIESKSTQAAAGKNMPIVGKACEYMQRHCSDIELTQAEVAEQVGVTPAYLSGIFKKAMGVTMMQYLSMVRLEKARELLLGKEIEVREAAALAGYSDEYYFSRCFKKYYGVSPSQVKHLKTRNSESSTT